MSDFVYQYREIWGEVPLSLMEGYNYHLELTKELDELNPEELSRETFYKIVLWKLSRFPYITDKLLEVVKEAANIAPKDHNKARSIITELLKTPGIALPMASTILRFINPNTFQIIDDRVYRVLLPGEPKYPSKPQKITEGYLNKSIDIYFRYLDRVHEVSSKKLPFILADRILYQLDIKLGKKIGD